MFEFQSTTEADGGYWGEATAVTNRQMSSSTEHTWCLINS